MDQYNQTRTSFTSPELDIKSRKDGSLLISNIRPLLWGYDSAQKHFLICEALVSMGGAGERQGIRVFPERALSSNERFIITQNGH